MESQGNVGRVQKSKQAFNKEHGGVKVPEKMLLQTSRRMEVMNLPKKTITAIDWETNDQIYAKVRI